MKQLAVTLPLILCIAASTACSSSTTPASGSGGHAGSAGSGAGGSSGSGAGGSGATTGTTVPLPIDATGYMSEPSLMIKGAWYAYGDGLGTTGMPPGDCDDPAKGKHMASECSTITTPLPGSFDNTGGAMHTAGTVEGIIAIVGMTGCPPAGAACDYNNMWGAGIGCDLNNGGAADGGTAMKNPYDATANGVIGIAFDIDAVPSTGLRVEFPTPATLTTAHVWNPSDAASNFISPVMAGTNVIMFATDVSQPSYVMPPVPFDPTQILSVQFHVPTSTSSSGTYDFTISNFAAITQ